MKYLKVLTTGFILTLSTLTHAGLVTTHGFLTSDSATNYVTDTNSGRLYTRFDAFSLSYAETLNAIDVGGQFEGWKIATTTEAEDWISAILGIPSAPCDASAVCGLVSDWTKGDFGPSTFSSNNDHFAYLSNAGSSNPLGLGQVNKNDASNFGSVWNDLEWESIEVLDSVQGINLLLYKDNVSVPEPSTLAIFALGLIGLSSRRFKKKS